MRPRAWSWLGLPIGALSMVVVRDLGGTVWGGLALGTLLICVAALVVFSSEDDR